MKVLVTGATGFLGSRLSCWLLSLGYEVVGLGRDKERGRALTNSGVRFVEAGLSDLAKISDSVDGAHAVVHCAALSSAWGSYEEFHEANVLGTQSIVNACVSMGVSRLVHISTTSLYFDYKDRFGIAESDPLAAKPASAYTRSKIEAEEIIRELSDLEWIILRPRGIFGPGDRAIIPRALRVARKGWFPMIRGGHALVDLTYVDNLCHAIELSLQVGKVGVDQIYNISNDEPISVREFFGLLMSHLEMKPRLIDMPLPLILSLASVLERFSRRSSPEPVLTKYTAGLLGVSQTLDIGKSKRLLGYRPLVNIRDGIQETAESIPSL